MVSGALLGPDFFTRNVHDVGPQLVGCTFTVDGVGGPIVEVECYDQTDPASHSFRGPTSRTAPMFGPPGHLYVYLSYGMHWCVNLVCGPEGRGEAVLIRAIEPISGVEEMRRRRPGSSDRQLCAGPGRLTRALGLTGADNGLAVSSGEATQTRIEIRRAENPLGVASGPRIGISRAVERPWRHCLAGSPFLSKPAPTREPAAA